MNNVAAFFRATWRFFERVAPLALFLAGAALLFQVIAARLQAESLSWQLLTSDARGTAGKAEALKYLNDDNAPRIPLFKEMQGWARAMLGKDYVDRDGKLVLQAPPLIKMRQNLDGIDLSLGYDSKSGQCDADSASRVILQQVELADAQMMGAILRCVDFRGPAGRLALELERKFSGANFVRAKLQMSDFSGATLDFATFQRADYRSAKFDKARMVSVDFSGSRGRGASFVGVEIGGGTTFNSARLPEAKFRLLPIAGGPHALADQVVRVDFRGATLTKASFQGYAIEADFSPSERPHCFHGEGPVDCPSDLSGADLSYVRWSGSNFSGASMAGTNLSAADLSDTRGLTGEMLGSARCLDKFTLLPDALQGAPLKECKPTEVIDIGKPEKAELDDCNGPTQSPVLSGKVEAVADNLEVHIKLCGSIVRFVDKAVDGSAKTTVRDKFRSEIVRKAVNCVQSRRDPAISGEIEAEETAQLGPQSRQKTLVAKGWCALADASGRSQKSLRNLMRELIVRDAQRR